MKHTSGKDEIIRNIMLRQNAMVAKVAEAVEMTCVDIANHAKSNHQRNSAHSQSRYEERTGVLTKSIGSKLLSVDAMKVVGTVFAGTDYAFYVEFGTKINRRTGLPNKPYPFFQPAMLMGKSILFSRIVKAQKSG